jgi:hypothetical protein
MKMTAREHRLYEDWLREEFDEYWIHLPSKPFTGSCFVCGNRANDRRYQNGTIACRPCGFEDWRERRRLRFSDIKDSIASLGGVS